MSAEVGRYWMHETSGVLRGPVIRYIGGEDLSDGDIAALRAYFRQWVAGFPFAPTELHLDVEKITNRAAIDRWCEAAIDAGLDPL